MQLICPLCGSIPRFFSSPGVCFVRTTPTSDLSQKIVHGFCLPLDWPDSDFYLLSIFTCLNFEPVEILGSCSEPLSLASSDGVEKDHHVHLSMVQLERALDGEAEA